LIWQYSPLRLLSAATNWHKFADTWDKVALEPEKIAKKLQPEPEFLPKVASRGPNDRLHQELIRKNDRLRHE
jgi:hypothetical protein